jgi:hypothetical protein
MTSHPPTGSELAANKAVVQSLVDEVLNGGNLDLIDDLYAPDQAAAARDWIAPFRASFPDVQMDTVEHTLPGRRSSRPARLPSLRSLERLQQLEHLRPTLDESGFVDLSGAAQQQHALSYGTHEAGRTARSTRRSPAAPHRPLTARTTVSVVRCPAVSGTA